VDAQSQAWLEQLLAAAANIPAAEREAYIRQACGDRTDLAEAALERFKSPLPTKTIPVAASTAQMIGPYRVLRELGKGGMGVVYLAVRDDGAFRKNVAIKLLRGDAVTHEFVERFRNERQVLANFDHPNIARILDGGDTTDGMPFYVMEYVEGRPIDRYCDEEKLSLNDRLRLYQKLIAAVHYLHQNHVVHRDLKPSNVLVASDGTVKLLDFGIAKQLGPASMELTTAEGTPLTPAYASPEQFTGRADTKSDVYTLGVILYLILTGRLPDQGTVKPPSESVREDYQRTQETTKQLKKRIMGDLDMVVLKAMSRESRSRYATAQEFSEDLERFLQGQPVHARPRKTMPLLATAAGVALLLCAGGAAWYFTQQPESTNTVTVQPEPKPIETQPQATIETAPPTTTPTTEPQPTTPEPTKTNAAPKPSAHTTTASIPAQPITQPITQSQAPPSTPAPQAPPVAAIPANSPELDDAREKLAVLSGKAAATEQLLAKVKADLEAKGLNLRAETLSRMTSMKLNLSLAQENISRGNAEAALRNLSIADALSTRVNKELGR
jgi:serine/threonine protein kinase